MADFFGLDWMRGGSDIERFHLKPIYIPVELFDQVVSALQDFQKQYGLMEEFGNESAVGHFVSAVLFLSKDYSHLCRFYLLSWDYLTGG